MSQYICPIKDMLARQKYNGLQNRKFNWKIHFYKSNLEELLQENDKYSLKQLKSLVHDE
jgi:hypothetical protein